MEKVLFGAALHCPTTPKVSQMRPIASTHPIVIAKTYVAVRFLNYGDTTTTRNYQFVQPILLIRGADGSVRGVPWRYTGCGESTQGL